MANEDKQSVVSGAVESGPATHVLSPLQVANLLRFDAEMRAASSDFSQAAEKRKELLAKIDPQGEVDKLGGVMNKSQYAYLDFQSRRDELVKEIEIQFGINLNEYAFNKETGVLSHAQPEESKTDEPAQPVN